MGLVLFEGRGKGVFDKVKRVANDRQSVAARDLCEVSIIVLVKIVIGTRNFHYEMPQNYFFRSLH